MAKTRTRDAQERRLEKCLRFMRRQDPWAWTGERISALRRLSAGSASDDAGLSADAARWRRMLAERGFVSDLRIESACAHIDWLDAKDRGETFPPLTFPGLPCAWRARPTLLKMDGGMEEALAGAIEGTSALPDVAISAIDAIMPCCLFVDVERFGCYDYEAGIPLDSLFIYPAYDAAAAQRALVIAAASQRAGECSWGMLLLGEGETIADAVRATQDATDIAFSRHCAASVAKVAEGDVNLAYPLDANSYSIVEAAGLILTAALADGTAYHKERSRGLLKITAAKGTSAGAAAPFWEDGGPDEAAPSLDGPEAPGEGAPDGGRAPVPTGEPSLLEPGEGDAGDRRAGANGDEAAPHGIRLGPRDAGIPASDGAPKPRSADRADYAIVSLVESEFPLEDLSDGPAGEADSDYIALAEGYAAECDRLSALLDAERSRASALKHHLDAADVSARTAAGSDAAASLRSELLLTLDLPRTPAEALDLAALAFPDRLVVLDSARRGAERFQKGSAREMWAVLRDAAAILHPIIFGGSPYPERDFGARSEFELALREVKQMKANPSFAALRRVEYKGGMRDCTPHIKGKGVKKGEALRVHFFADYDEGRLVIAYAGEHLASIDTPRL